MSNPSYLFRKATLLTGDTQTRADLLVSQGIIQASGMGLNKPDEAVVEVDASPYLIMPAAIDPHVHLQLPTPAGNSSDDFVSGSMAAISGGTASLIDFVTPRRGQLLPEALHERLNEAKNCRCDYLLHLGISEWNSEVEKGLRICAESGGIRSVKAYLAYRQTIGINDVELSELMRVCHDLNLVLCIHCEDGERIDSLRGQMLAKGVNGPAGHLFSRPPETESDAVARVLELVKETSCTVYLVHISTAASIGHIRKAKEADLPVYAETCPQYLLLDKTACYRELPDSLAYVISPPLRSAADREALWAALADGTIDTIGTDHCPFNLRGQKDLGINNFTIIPNGTGGIENRMELLFTYGVLENRISLNRWVSLCCEMPARIFDLFPRKGSLRPGADADLLLWDTKPGRIIRAANLFQNCDHSVYEGFSTQGQVHFLMKNGGVIFQEGEHIQDLPSGRFLGS